MNTSDLVSRLQGLGLDEEQAKVYLTLLRLGPSKASDIKPHFDWSRSKVYRVLEDLNKGGAVSKTLESPTIFHPAPPEELFSLRREELNLQEKRFSELESSFYDTLKTIQTETEDTDYDHYSRMEGLQTILQILQQLFTEAEESIDVAGSYEVLTAKPPLVEDVWRVMLGKAAEGVPVRVIGSFEREPQVHVEDGAWRDETEFRALECEEPFLFVLVDGEDLVHWIRTTHLRPGPDLDDVAVLTNGPAVRAAYELLFEKIWADGEDIIDEIQAALLDGDADP